MARQLPLEFGHATGFSRDDLVVSKANAEAVRLIERWPDWPTPAVVLVGPPGAGKSHLAAIWREAAGAIDLIGTRSMPVFKDNRSTLVDDADQGDIDQIALFHLLNAAAAGGVNVLLTARRPPAAWDVRLPDLLSRLRAATLVEIKEPDDDLLTGVITKLFADRQVEIEPSVIGYLARRMERSLSSAIRLVDRLDRMALEQQTRISRALAAQALGMVDDQPRPIDP